MDDKALFESATADTPVETPEQPAEVQAEPPEPEAQPRDEHGRFAPKVQAEPEQPQPIEQPAPEPVSQQPQDVIPPWRLREEAEARRAAEKRLAEQEFQIRQLSERVQQFTAPKQEPVDPYADPEKFRDMGVQQALNPVVQQFNSMREYYSRKAAVAAHGQDAVKEAYGAFEQAARSGDPSIRDLMQRVMSGLDPFEDIVSWHKQNAMLKDPQAWAMSQISEWAKDPTRKNAMLAALNGQPAKPSTSEKPTNVVKLPPSLNKSPGSAQEPIGDLTSASLYDFATR